MKRRPYAKARTTATSSRRARLSAQMARMDEKMKAKKAEAAKKAAAKKAADAKTKAKNQAARKAADAKPRVTLGQDKKRKLKSKPEIEKKAPPAGAKRSLASKGAGSRARNQAASKITGRTMTRAGEYKTFAKGSSAARNFRSAFSEAKAAGKKTFTWNGKKYTTKTK